MKVIVLGAGVIGVTSAWYLNQAGFDVTVIERQAQPAQETSFANAGQLSFGYAMPWAAPGIPLKALQWLFQEHAPLHISPDGSLRQWQWMMMMLANCNKRAYHVNKSRLMRLAEYSRLEMQHLRAQTAIRYHDKQAGTLQLFRDLSQMEAAAKDMAVLREFGVPHQLIETRQGLAAIEPALAHRSALVGGLHLPQDETGDCAMFTQSLAAMAQAAGVTFMYETKVSDWLIEGQQIKGVVANKGALEADQVVVALGSFSYELMQSLKLSIPVYPVKGYSLSLPLIDKDLAPVSTVLDESYKVAVTRLGDTLRVGGMAELHGYDYALNPTREATLLHVVRDLFPGAAKLDETHFWTGLRPMTPDGTPIIGATPYPNVWLNTGHGTLGWTLAAGSAAYLADCMAKKTPAIATEGLSMSRYQ
jgi:D-amino-acid dehydrogenase